MREAAAQHTTEEWMVLGEQHRIPIMRANTMDGVLEDPHLKDRDFFQFRDHPSEGRIRTMREPSTWSDTAPVTNGRFAPRLGEHTREILIEAGYTNDEIDALIDQHAVMTEAS